MYHNARVEVKGGRTERTVEAWGLQARQALWRARGEALQGSSRKVGLGLGLALALSNLWCRPPRLDTPYLSASVIPQNKINLRVVQ